MSVEQLFKQSATEVFSGWMEYGTERAKPPVSSQPAEPTQTPVNTTGESRLSEPAAPPTQPNAPPVAEAGGVMGTGIQKKHLMIAGGVLGVLVAGAIGWKVLK